MIPILPPRGSTDRLLFRPPLTPVLFDPQFWPQTGKWLRGRDLNPRPLGYENEGILPRVLFSLL